MLINKLLCGTVFAESYKVNYLNTLLGVSDGTEHPTKQL